MKTRFRVRRGQRMTSCPGGDIESSGARERRAAGAATHLQTRPAVHLNMADIVRERSSIEAELVDRGVPARDLPDAVQDVFLGAWRSMQADRFRPPPDVPVETALERWILGVAWRQASHYMKRASFRYEVLMADPEELIVMHEPAPCDRIGARMSLCTLRRLAPRFREVLSRAALGWRVDEIAAELGVNPNTTATRLRIARRRFAQGLVRWRTTDHDRKVKRHGRSRRRGSPS